MFVNAHGRRLALNEKLVEELIGDGCLSDLDFESDEEPTVETRLLCDDTEDLQRVEEAKSDTDVDVPLALPRKENEPELQGLSRKNKPYRRIQERRRIWRASPFENKSHDFPAAPIAPEVKTPLQYFEVYFSPFFFENVAHCTNTYHMRKTGSVLNTNSQEIRKLFGVFLLMGCIPFPRIHMYWRAGLRLEVIAEKLTRDRYFLLRNNLHVVETDDPPPENSNPLWKVQPMLDAVKNACKRIERLPGRYSIDEQIIPFTGKCKLRVFIKNKPRTVGLKNYVITTSEGLMIDFQIYYPNNPIFAERQLGEGPAVILALAQNVPPNSCLYFDRYFTTIPLLDRLTEMQLHGTGTIMLNRVPGHKNLDLKKDSSMKRGDVVQFTSQDVVLVKWKDNKAVLVASNCTGGDHTTEVPRWDKKEKKYVQVPAPQIILNYNKNMGGVDVLDQLLEYYRTFQKTKKWTVKVLIHFIDLAAANAWRQYKNDCESQRKKAKDLLWFRMDLADALIASLKDQLDEESIIEDEESVPGPSKKRYRPVVAPSLDKRYDKHNHLPHFDDLSRGRKCRLENCKSSTNVRCIKCNVYLCLLRNQNCFLTYHTK